MTVKIENCLSENPPHKFDVNKAIVRLLKPIPSKHLVGLERIIIVRDVSRTTRIKAAALYWPKSNHENAKIEISFSAVYRNMPKILYWFPFIPNFVLANVLYHEIGHHYCHQIKHSHKKYGKEVCAEAYKKKLLYKAFFWWGLVLYPIKPVVKLLSKKQL